MTRISGEIRLSKVSPFSKHTASNARQAPSAISLKSTSTMGRESCSILDSCNMLTMRLFMRCICASMASIQRAFSATVESGSDFMTERLVEMTVRGVLSS